VANTEDMQQIFTVTGHTLNESSAVANNRRHASVRLFIIVYAALLWYTSVHNL